MNHNFSIWLCFKAEPPRELDFLVKKQQFGIKIIQVTPHPPYSTLPVLEIGTNLVSATTLYPKPQTQTAKLVAQF
jgi:hypothetical protein